MSLSPAALKILLLVIYSIISVSALILIKLGGAHRPWLPPIDWSRIAQLVAGCTLYVCSFAIWIFVLSIMELTAAYPIAIALTLKNGDYLLAFTGNKLATWFHRGVTPYFSKDSLLKTQNAYDMQLVAEDEIKSPALYINTWNYRPEIRQTSLGYKLYRVLEDEPKFLWSGRYPDGWMGTTASLLVNENFKGPVAIRISAPYFAMPNKITITRNDEIFRVLELTDTDEKIVMLRQDGVGKDQFSFKVERAVSPKKLKINTDKRELGLRITLDEDYLAKH